MNSLVIANILSFIGKACFIVSSASNTKKRMLIIQVFNAIFDGLACLISGSYAGAITNLIAIFRNILAAKNIDNKLVTISICLIMLTTGIIFNNKGVIGFFPIIASISYTLIIIPAKNVTVSRIGLIVNRCLWLVHDIYFLLIPAIIINIVILIILLFKMIQNVKHKETMTGLENKTGENNNV